MQAHQTDLLFPRYAPAFEDCKEIAALVLSTPYPSITAVAFHRFHYLLPIPWMNRNPVPASRWAAGVTCPVLALQGGADKLIPISLGLEQASHFRALLNS